MTQKTRGTNAGLAAFCFLFLNVLPAFAQANGDLQIHYLNVGQGDAALIISPLGQTMLIDSGPLSANSCASGILATLTAIGLTHLDYHVASHYDADHIGCSDFVVARWPVQAAAYDRGTSSPPTTQTYGRYATALASTRQQVSVGQIIVLDAGTTTPVTLRVVAVNGNGQSVSDENDRSIVLLLHFGGFDAEFGGDLPGVAASGHKDIESAIAGDVGQVEVYKVHHHGSATSSNATFMTAIHPKVAVLSVGSPNAFDHPTQSALDRIRAVGTTTYWTTAGDGAPAASPFDLVVNGTVFVDVPSDGLSFSVKHGSTTDSYASWGASCTYALSSTSATYPSSGGSGSVNVTTGPSCPWTANSNAPFLAVTGGATGRGSGTVTYAVDSTGRADDGTLTVAGFIFTVNQSGPVVAGPPFGSFDTPLQGQTGLAGSIAITGWALDDAGVDRVELWRDLVPGETTVPFNSPGHPGHGKVYIANPLFVSGARPDVAAAYAAYPNADRAGWGYLLLTWGLWNQGNGPFTLYAFAFDGAGNYTTLGTKSIVVSNQTAVKPFGGIDIPTYGQTVTGSFWNYGWALTPHSTPTCTIQDGSVSMSIDSGPLTPVAYGGARADIATAFAGFSNGGNAGGAYYLNTRALTNGPHSIGWFVVDNCGRADGIGSRFFTVQNDSPSLGAARGLPFSTLSTKASPDPVVVQKNAGERHLQYPNTQDVRIVALGQSDRVEVQLPRTVGVNYAGHQVVNARPLPLPVGSSLDAQAGVFYWQPGPGFLGSYDLAFVPTGTRADQPAGISGPSTARVVHVRVVVGPPVRMRVDGLVSGQTVQQPFAVTGWALDLAAAEGSGIDTLHVWAYPVTGGAPVFLGVATTGDWRPDVARTYGEQFQRSSFSLAVEGLVPGTYDLVVYAHREATGAFDGAEVVRITVR